MKKIVLIIISGFRYFIGITFIIFGISYLTTNLVFSILSIFTGLSMTPLIKYLYLIFGNISVKKRRLLSVFVPVLLFFISAMFSPTTNQTSAFDKAIEKNESSGFFDFLGLDNFKLLKSTIEIEAGVDFNPKDYYDTEKFENVTIKDSVNPNTVGEYNVEYLFEDSTKLLKVIVKDTTPPKVTAKESTIFVNQIINVESMVEVEDLSEFEVSFKNEPDWTVIGDQSVTIIVKDSESNISEINVLLQIVEDPQAEISNYFLTVSSWSDDLLQLVIESRSHFKVFDGSEKWNKEMDDIYFRFLIEFDEFLKWNVPSEVEKVNNYIDLASSNYLKGLNSLREGIKESSPEKVELLQTYWDTASAYLDLAGLEALNYGMSLD